MKNFPRQVSRAAKATRGATAVESTPLQVRGRPPLAPAAEARMRARAARALGRWATLITAIVVRIDEDRCSIDASTTVAGKLHVEGAGRTGTAAFSDALKKLERVARRAFGRRGASAGRSRGGPAPKPLALEPAPSMVGRREGRSALARAMARARPEKKRRDLWTDTARPGVSETDRVAGGGHTARRNTRKRTSGMTVMLEDSLAKPSRKSTRRSANRGKPSQGKERAARAKSTRRSRKSR